MSSKDPQFVYSPQYRKAPASRAETVIGLFIVFTLIASVFIGALGDVLVGSLMFLGAVLAYAAVIAARNAR